MANGTPLFKNPSTWLGLLFGAGLAGAGGFGLSTFLGAAATTAATTTTTTSAGTGVGTMIGLGAALTPQILLALAITALVLGLGVIIVTLVHKKVRNKRVSISDDTMNRKFSQQATSNDLYRLQESARLQILDFNATNVNRAEPEIARSRLSLTVKKQVNP